MDRVQASPPKLPEPSAVPDRAAVTASLPGATAASSPASTPPGRNSDADAASASTTPGRTSRYSTPGEGSSTVISTVTVVVLIALWWIASHRRWLPELFLPTPEIVFLRLWESARGELTDAPLATHFGWSLLRVF